MKTDHKILTAFIIFLFSFLSIARGHSYDDPLVRWAGFSKSNDARKIISWMQCSMKDILDNNKCSEPLDISTPPFYGQLGVFVTLVKKGKVRGCYGAFHHQSDKIEDVLREYLKGALKRDHRYRPIDAGEISDVDIIITIAGSQYSVDNINNIDVINYGVAVTFNNNESDILVPSEIKNTESLKNRLKGKEVNQITVFKAVTIR